MLSYFPTGITQTIPTETIHLQRLVELTVKNPQSELIKEIRRLRFENDNTFKTKKRELSNVTPACVLRIRHLENHYFVKNFVISSGYVFIDFDFDDIGLVEERKKEFIDMYGDKIAYCAISSSRGGLSVLVRVDARINSKEEYNEIWHHLTREVFTDFKADESTKDIGRAMYISHDPDVYVNYNSLVDLKSVQVSTYGVVEGEMNTLCINKTRKKRDRSSTEPIKIKSSWVEDDILAPSSFTNVLYRTPIDVVNPIVDIEEREYEEVFFSNEIPDGNKHPTYINIIYKLLRLNPGLSKDDLLFEMFSINNRQKIKMESKRVRELVDSNFELYHSSEFTYRWNKRMIHFNKSCGLTAYQRTCIANEINARIRMNKSIKSIQNAKALIASQGEKITKANVARISGLGRTTVHKYFDMEEVNMKDVERFFNENEIQYPRHPDPDKKKRKRDRRLLDEN